jgi:hydroxymethylpyrimidine/phosphomethylpyrimidine kinase
MAQKQPYCLTIAGFDPSGGAGVIADCKTFGQHRVHGLSAITCNTVQTEDRFLAFNWTADDLLLQQIEVLLQRYKIRFVKIGIVRDLEQLTAILNLLARHIERPYIVWDPILKPTAGGVIDPERFTAQLADILPQISVLTPNLPEYSQLFGTADPATIAAQYNLSIYLKGGHAEIPGKDLIYQPGKMHALNPKIRTSLQKHGTGCVLSSALTAHMASQYPFLKACLRSKRYVERYLLSDQSLLGFHR